MNYLLVGALAIWLLLGVLEWVLKFKKSRQDRPGKVTNVQAENKE